MGRKIVWNEWQLWDSFVCLCICSVRLWYDGVFQQTKCKESRIIGLYLKWQYLQEYNHLELSHAIHDQRQMNGKDEKEENLHWIDTHRDYGEKII